MSIATLRVEYRAALLGILTDFRNANPTLLRQVHKARPGTFNPPMGYVGPFNEPTIVHETGNRLARPDLRGSLVLVQGVYDAGETADKLDVLTDALLVYLATQHSRVAGQLLEAISAEDVELNIKDVPYSAVIVTTRVNAP